MGKPVVFIRLSGCNLIAFGKGCKFCDSLYAEKGDEISVDEIITKVKSYDCKNIVITGGEPLYQIDELTILVEKLDDMGYYLDIETNGTIFDHNVLWYFYNINCSPKKQMVDIDILRKMKKLNTNFKFVYESKTNRWWEGIIEDAGINKKDVYIMPEGKTREEQIKRTPEVIEYCKEKGYNFTPRLHVLVWDIKIGV